jgi:alpha/beta superfamily hydrolase
MMLNASTAIRSLFLDGPAGRLEALLNEGRPDARYAAVVCHPHPMYGGTMHNKVVFHTMKAIHAFGIPVLRFNFRGAGLSEGTHDNGRGERDDVRTVVDWLDREFRLPIIFAGFSFGAATGLHVCCPDSRVAALISLGTPVEVQGRVYGYGFLEACEKPKLLSAAAKMNLVRRTRCESWRRARPNRRNWPSSMARTIFLSVIWTSCGRWLLPGFGRRFTWTLRRRCRGRDISRIVLVVMANVVYRVFCFAYRALLTGSHAPRFGAAGGAGWIDHSTVCLRATGGGVFVSEGIRRAA